MSVEPRVNSKARKGHLANPLSPSVFLIRNLGKSVPLLGVIVLAVLLIAGIVSIMNSIPLSIRTIYSYSREYLGISPRGDAAMIPKLRVSIERDAPVEPERIIVCRASSATVRSLVGKWPFVMIGLGSGDTEYYLRRMGARVLEGRLPRHGEAAAIVSEPVARNLGLRIGSAVLRPDVQENYSPYPVKVVGIARTDRWLMVGDIEYQRRNHFPPVDNLIVFARTREDQERLDRWAEEAFKGKRAHVFAYHLLERDTNEMFGTLYKILNVVIGILVLVITVMMGMLMNIYQGQRLVEFGLLQAIGYTKRELLSRMRRETLLVLSAGWAMGMVAAYLLLSAVKAALFEPNAYSLDPLDSGAYLYTIPVPLSVLAAATLTVWLRFRRFDPVAVVERRLA